MSIVGSVGRSGRNSVADSMLVQGLLNPHAAKLGLALLDVDGICGPLTIAAITQYQRIVMRIPSPDGRVDPSGATFVSLANTPPPADGVISVFRKIKTLTIHHFGGQVVVIDPGDKSVVQAYTAFDYIIPNVGARMVGATYAMGIPNTIEIVPRAVAAFDAELTPYLLRHEQFHYDVGMAVARALARDLMVAREPSLAALKATFDKLEDLHFVQRAGLIQKRYDRETQHGANEYYQKLWLDRMRACLANQNAKEIGGFWL